MRKRMDLTTYRASVAAVSIDPFGSIRRNRTGLSPATGRERPMLVEEVGRGVALVVPYTSPAERVLHFLLALVGEVMRRGYRERP